MSYQCTEKEFLVYLPHRYFIPVQSQGCREKTLTFREVRGISLHGTSWTKGKRPVFGSRMVYFIPSRQSAAFDGVVALIFALFSPSIGQIKSPHLEVLCFSPGVSEKFISI